MSAEYATHAAVLKALHAYRKPANPNYIIFFSGEKNFNLYQKTMSQPDGALVEGNEANQLTRLKLFILFNYLMDANITPLPPSRSRSWM
jgi:hypothetical protein